MIRVELERVQGDFGFAAKDASGHIVSFDGSPDIGGQDSGVRPMQTLLMALGSCSAIDIVSILKKQKQELSVFKMTIEGERGKGHHVSLWTNIHILFEFGGNAERDKIERACALSIQKYCSVAETLRRAGAKITWDILIY